MEQSTVGMVWTCLNEISDLEEFQAIVGRERDCGHDAYGVDFKRLHQQDQGLGGCKFHWKCPVGLKRTAEIRELRKSKAESRARVTKPGKKAQLAKSTLKRSSPDGKPLDSLYTEDDSVSGLISIAHFSLRMILIR